MQFELSVGITEPSWREGARGLLAPVPPNTPHQRCVDHGLPAGWRGERVVARDGRQQALWITEVDDLGAPIRYGLLEAADPPEPADYRPVMNRFTALPAGLQPVVERLRAEAPSEEELLRQAARYVASRFRYDPTPSSGAFPDVACDIQRGNCLDVNTVLLSLLYACGVAACYDIGYYFLDRARACDGWHCWISALPDGRHQDWDVPHHLKFGVEPLGPGLNPRPGLRFCMSRGRGLQFDLDGTVVETSHFCRPRWVLADGATAEAPIAASWTAR